MQRGHEDDFQWVDSWVAANPGRGYTAEQWKHHFLGVSKKLSYILRHGAAENGLTLRADASIALADLLRHRTFRDFSMEEVDLCVEHDAKTRYLIFEEDGQKFIRAQQGHTKRVGKVNQQNLTTPITRQNCPKMAVHGTFGTNMEATQAAAMAVTSFARQAEAVLKRAHKWDSEFLCLGSSSETFSVPRPEELLARITANLDHFSVNYAICLLLFALIAIVVNPKLLVLACVFSGLWYGLFTRPPHMQVKVGEEIITKWHLQAGLGAFNLLIVIILAHTVIFATIGAALLCVLLHASFRGLPSNAFVHKSQLRDCNALQNRAAVRFHLHGQEQEGNCRYHETCPFSHEKNAACVDWLAVSGMLLQDAWDALSCITSFGAGICSSASLSLRDQLLNDPAKVKAQEERLKAQEDQLRNIQSKVQAQEDQLLKEQAAKSELHSKLKEQEQRLRKEQAKAAKAQVTRPPRWGQPHRRWVAVPVANDEWWALSEVLRPAGPLSGRDYVSHTGHSRLHLSCAWRIENDALWAKYSAEKSCVHQCLHSLKRSAAPKLGLRQALKNATSKLDNLDPGVCEVYLCHGTKPDTVLSILEGGVNERFSGGMFGHGTYFAEDCAKNDQYVVEDRAYNSGNALHQELYSNSTKHPGNVYYVFCCRVVLGHFVRTKDGSTDMDGPRRSLWSSDRRELAAIPGSRHHHHSLVAETGGCIHNFREFVLFHSDRVYPEYLLAYQRRP